MDVLFKKEVATKSVAIHKVGQQRMEFVPPGCVPLLFGREFLLLHPNTNKRTKIVPVTCQLNRSFI